MNLEPTPFPYRYSGGSLGSDDPTYIMRPADRKFYNALKDGDFCYILNSRQMGKTSLSNRAMQQLQQEGFACLSIDLSAIIETKSTVQQFYSDLIWECISGFQLNVTWKTFYERYKILSPRKQFSNFIETFLFRQIQARIVIFFDEIDSILRFNDPGKIDEFLNIIRFFYNVRATKPAYKKLSCAFLGVATPYKLTRDKFLISFNIGRSIEIDLTGFKLEEALPLAQGLSHIAARPKTTLKAILFWTGGQPFLTQKLCWLVANSQKFINAGEEKKRVRQIVQAKIIDDWESHDDPPHLKTIRDRLQNPPAEAQLQLYQKVLRSPQFFNKNSPVVRELSLSGIVSQQSGKLQVYNRIYREVFNRAWVKEQLPPAKPSLSLFNVLATSLLVTAIVMGARSLGLLQTWELQAFDLLLRMRPEESPDDRLLVVEVTEEDIEQYNHPLPDGILAQLVEKLAQNRPQVIGLDIYRSNPVRDTNAPIAHQIDFPTHLRQNERLISICKVSSASDSGITPLPGIPVERLGFSNVVQDRDDTIRRHLLFQTPPANSPCQASYPLNLQLAFRYLAAKGIFPEFTPAGDLQFGTTVFEDLPSRAGGYQRYDPGGQQILLDYRAAKPIARTVTLSEVLQGKLNPDWVENRIVIIGVTATSIKDNFQTPYGEQRGLFIQAAMLSQILSNVLDERPVLQPLPQWLDGFLILGSAAVGAILLERWRSPLYRILGGGIAWGVLLGLSYAGLIRGYWFPVVPVAIALVTAGAIVTVDLRSANRSSRFFIEFKE